MKLIGYELYKLVQKRMVMLLTIFLFFLNGIFYINEEHKENGLLIKYRDHYERLEQSYKSLSRAEGKRLTSAQVEQLVLYGLFVQASVSPKDSPWQTIVADLKRDNKQAFERYERSPYFNEEQAISRDVYLINLLKLQYDHADRFDNKINSMEDHAHEMLSVSIFNDKDSFSYRNIVKTVEDFKPLRGLRLQLGLEEGVVTGTNFEPTDFCMAILLFMLITILFYVEKEEGLTPLVRTTRYGKLRTFGAKWAVLTLATVIFSFLYYGSILLMAERLYGFGELTRYVQSMSSFNNTSEPLTVKHYLFVYMLLKIAVNVVLGWFVSALFLGLGHISKVYVAISILLGASYLCYTLIHPNSYMNVCKYVNVFAFYDTFQLVADYRNLNIFGFPVRKDTLTFGILGAMLIALPIGSAWLFVRRQGAVARPTWLRGPANWQTLWWRNKRTNSLFMHEGYKLLVVGKSALILIFAVILTYNRIDRHEHQFDLDSGIYNRYISQLHGELSKDKLLFIDQEREKFTALARELAILKQKLTNKQIDLITYNEEKFKIDEYAKQEKAFQLVEQQRDYLIRLQQKEGITGSFVNSITSDALFNRPKDDLRDGIIYGFLLIVALSPLFATDYKNGMMKVIWSSTKGRGRVFAVKYTIACLYAVGLLVLMKIPHYYNVVTRYPALEWNAPIQSIESLGYVTWPLSTLAYAIVTSLLQVLGALMIVHVILFTAVVMKKQSFFLIAATSVIVLPLCLQYMGLSIISKYSFNFVFELYGKFNTVSYAIGTSVYFAVLLAIGIAALRGAWTVINRFEWRED